MTATSFGMEVQSEGKCPQLLHQQYVWKGIRIMIRAAIISIVFLGITLTLVVLQPSSDRHHSTTVTETDDATVTRAQTEPDPLESLTDNLAAVGVAVEEQQAIVEPTALTTAVTAPAKTVIQTAVQATALAEPTNDLEQLIVSALKQGQSENYIDALVNDAATQGTVEVPDSLVTQDGRVDTSSLLAVLSAPTASAGIQATNSYVVQAGDSLASIAYRFYGSTGKAVDIFTANRNILSSPNDVEVGMQLVMPTL